MTGARRLLPLLMALALALGLLPLIAFAEEAPQSDDLAVGQMADASQASLSDVAFVYVESPQVAVGAAENIVIGFADDGLVVEGAGLELLDPVARQIVSSSKGVERLPPSNPAPSGA